MSVSQKAGLSAYQQPKDLDLTFVCNRNCEQQISVQGNPAIEDLKTLHALAQFYSRAYPTLQFVNISVCVQPSCYVHNKGGGGLYGTYGCK